MSINIFDIHHDSFVVKDLTIALDFYCNVLQLDIDTTRPDMSIQGAWLKIGERRQIHLLVIDDSDDADADAAEQTHHKATKLKHGGRDRHSAFLINDMEKLKQALKQQDIAYTMSQSGRLALFTRDPDGNALEFIQR